MRVKVIETKDRSMWWHEVVDKENHEVIEIVTWKGVYVVDNKKPPPPQGIKPCIPQEQWIHDLKIGGRYGAIMIYDLECSCWKYFYTLVRQNYSLLCCILYYNPLTQTWGRNNVMDKLCKWALAQPPQPDFEGAKEDRQEVEETFNELDKEVNVQK
jgi:hypothetical protein